MITDFSLIMLYVLCVLLVRTRLSVYAFLAFSASIVLTSLVSEPWQPHAINACLYAGLALSCRPPVNRIAFAVVAFQYLMAWDAFLFSQFETMLYSVYPYVSSALNLALIFTISRAGSDNARDFSASYHATADRVFNL